MQKDRGKFLTTMLVLMIFMFVFSLYSSHVADYQEFYQRVPSWLPVIAPFWLLVDIAALIGIWLWKKTAVYVYAISTILGILMEAFLLRPTDEALVYAFFILILFGLLFWAISRKWKSFE